MGHVGCMGENRRWGKVEQRDYLEDIGKEGNILLK